MQSQLFSLEKDLGLLLFLYIKNYKILDLEEVQQQSWKV